MPQGPPTTISPVHSLSTPSVLERMMAQAWYQSSRSMPGMMLANLIDAPLGSLTKIESPVLTKKMAQVLGDLKNSDFDPRGAYGWLRNRFGAGNSVTMEDIAMELEKQHPMGMDYHLDQLDMAFNPRQSLPVKKPVIRSVEKAPVVEPTKIESKFMGLPADNTPYSKAQFLNDTRIKITPEQFNATRPIKVTPEMYQRSAEPVLIPKVE